MKRSVYLEQISGSMQLFMEEVLAPISIGIFLGAGLLFCTNPTIMLVKFVLYAAIVAVLSTGMMLVLPTKKTLYLMSKNKRGRR